MDQSTTRRSRTWLAVAVVFTLLNIGGAFPAAMQEEWMHAAAHVVLTFVGLYWASRVWRGRRQETPALASGYSDRLTNLEHSLDAVAVEIERIGEGQRFMTRVLTEQDAPQPIQNKPRKPD